jgi:hypothetical protein
MDSVLAIWATQLPCRHPTSAQRFKPKYSLRKKFILFSKAKATQKVLRLE